MSARSWISREEASSIDTLLFDLDDTLLTHGTLTRGAYDALWSLHDAGVALFAVTGRPSGWGEVVARQWPLQGVVAENGAVLIWRDNKAIVRSLRGSVESRARDRSRLLSIVDEVGLELADDNAARLTDVTFDIGEQVQVARDRIDVARALIDRRGARSILSSVHLHATFEGDDKASGALRMLFERRGLDPARARATVAFVGDSENDAACFTGFRRTFGVANVARALPRLSIGPRWMTKGGMGEGFAELAAALVSARENQPSP